MRSWAGNFKSFKRISLLLAIGRCGSAVSAVAGYLARVEVPKPRSVFLHWLKLSTFRVALQLRTEGDGKSARGGDGRGHDFEMRRRGAPAARRPAVFRWPRVARRDKPQKQRSLDWTRRKVPVPSASPSHAMAMVEVVKVSFRNKLDLVLRVEADPLQRE
jgi:hypothetical protein